MTRMVIDTSALVAVAFAEPERATFVSLIQQAGLNFGDVFSYALAKGRGLPLLFKGEDFAQTDLEAVWRPGSAALPSH